jgi:DNA polymerase I-like protein with 3'-5' exonuclease and polymerase domains
MRCLTGDVQNENLIEISESIVEKVKALVKQTMIEAGKFSLRSVPVKVDVTDSDTWKQP